MAQGLRLGHGNDEGCRTARPPRRMKRGRGAPAGRECGTGKGRARRSPPAANSFCRSPRRNPAPRTTSVPGWTTRSTAGFLACGSRAAARAFPGRAGPQWLEKGERQPAAYSCEDSPGLGVSRGLHGRAAPGSLFPSATRKGTVDDDNAMSPMGCVDMDQAQPFATAAKRPRAPCLESTMFAVDTEPLKTPLFQSRRHRC